MSGPILFLVPAHAGGRRAPAGNLALVGGIPLVGRAVRVGTQASATLGGDGDRVACSTDDEAIAAAAAAWGATALPRPAALATDEASSVDVALHALDALEAGGERFGTLVLLQPTSPLIEPGDVADAVRLHRETGAGVTSVVATSAAARHHGRDAAGVLGPAASVEGDDVRLTGGFSVVDPDRLRRTRRFVEPGHTRGFGIPADRAIDADAAWGLLAAEAVLAARPVRPVPIATATLGAGPVFVIAEAGVNHNGDPELAARLVDAAADCAADAVKFQTFDPAALAAAGAPTAAYQRAAGFEAADQRELLARLALPPEAWRELQTRASGRGLVFLSTPFDDRSAELLDGLGVPAFKVGSGELTNTPFLARLARLGRPLLVSTGMADMVEVATAVDTVRANGDVPLALLHCVSSYPAAPGDANLRVIETMRRGFGVPVGWSDHTPGIELALAAVAAGASLVEKHLTLDRDLPGPDHRASLEPAAFASMVVGIRAVEAALGTGVKAPVAAERDVAAVARRSLHWRASLPAGHLIEAADLDVLRPAGGLAPGRLASMVGRRTAREVTGGTAVEAADVEAGA